MINHTFRYMFPASSSHNADRYIGMGSHLHINQNLMLSSCLWSIIYRWATSTGPIITYLNAWSTDECTHPVRLPCLLCHLFFLALPHPPSEQWSPNLRAAHEVISNIYSHAVRVLNQEDTDPLCVAFHIDTIVSDAFPLLIALKEESESNPDQFLPADWL